MIVKTTKPLCAFVLGSAVSICGAAADENTYELLFVQTSEQFQADTDAKTLRMVNINPQTVYFTDRPYRLAGHINLERYVNGWDEGEDSFRVNPPNATLSVFEAEDHANELVVLELLDPVIEGQDLVYTYVVIDGAMPDTGGAASLFIDTIGRPGGGVGAGFHGVGVGARGPGVTGWAGAAIRECNGSEC